jgi:hypothetical protein
MLDITKVVESMLDEQRNIMIYGIINDPANEPEVEPSEAPDMSGADTGGEGDR